MSREVTVQDLPDEMLEKILLQLSLKDRKSAMRVCKRWYALKLLDMSSVQLVVDSGRFHRNDFKDSYLALIACSRPYKHIYFCDILVECDILWSIIDHFSESVESLQLAFSNDNALEYVEKASLKSLASVTYCTTKLKHLYIDWGGFKSDWADWDFRPMNNLEGLYLTNNLMLTSIPNMQDITPNITKLHTPITTNESLNFLCHFSSQLVELRTVINSHASFLVLCTMQFPLLEKAVFKFTNNRALRDESERLFQQLPELCQSLENIQVLCLLPYYQSIMDHDSLRAICKLKHLKRLHLGKIEISAAMELNFPPIKSLHVLSLNEVMASNLCDFSRFCQYAFPNLAVLEMISMQPYVTLFRTAPDMAFELYSNVCSNMPSMNRLTLSEPGYNLQLSQFLEFCASRMLRELRIRCCEVKDTYPLAELRPIPVETLIMDVSEISLEVLQKLIKSMPELKRLELAFSSGSDPHSYKMQPETIECLRDAFPRCKIVERKKVQIGEPL